MTVDATRLGLVGLETGDPNWRAAVYAELPLSDAELAEIVDEATPCARLGAGIGADVPTTLREVRELREQIAAARAYLAAHDEYDRTDRHPVDRAAARDARQAAFLAFREALP